MCLQVAWDKLCLKSEKDKIDKRGRVKGFRDQTTDLQATFEAQVLAALLQLVYSVASSSLHPAFKSQKTNELDNITFLCRAIVYASFLFIELMNLPEVQDAEVGQCLVISADS